LAISRHDDMQEILPSDLLSKGGPKKPMRNVCHELSLTEEAVNQEDPVNREPRYSCASVNSFSNSLSSRGILSSGNAGWALIITI